MLKLDNQSVVKLSVVFINLTLDDNALLDPSPYDSPILVQSFSVAIFGIRP